MTIDLELIACRDEDPEMFHPEHSGQAVKDAKAVCARCTQSMACLEEALAHRMAGIWGGTTERERNKMLRQATRVVDA